MNKSVLRQVAFWVLVVPAGAALVVEAVLRIAGAR